MNQNSNFYSRRDMIKFSLSFSAYLLSGCQIYTSNDEENRLTKIKKQNNPNNNKNRKIVLSSNEVIVQRSAPLVNSIVIDSNGKTALERENGIYRFKNRPLYPIYVFSGAVNINRNGQISVGDIKNSLMLGASKFQVITIITTLAHYDNKREWLKSSFNLTDHEIDKELPRQNRKIAAICDEILYYCVQNRVTKPSKIPISELYNLENKILDRIDRYLQSNKPIYVLEEELAKELKIELVNKDDVEYYKNGSTNPKVVINQLPKYELTDEQKYSLAFMWHEERLAGDAYEAFYNALYDSLNEQEKALADRVLKVITQSERLHKQVVEEIIKKYDIDILHLDEYDKKYDEEELKQMEPGKYPIKKLQEIWNNVAPVGTKDLISALKIGSITEVGDVEDLDRYIKTAGNAVDLRYVFEFLRDGSILHYWAFDRALKELGVSEGACSISSRYCKQNGEFSINSDGGTKLSLLNWVKEE